MKEEVIKEIKLGRYFSVFYYQIVAHEKVFGMSILDRSLFLFWNLDTKKQRFHLEIV